MTDERFNSLVKELRETLGLPFVEVGNYCLDLRHVIAIEQDWSLGRLNATIHLHDSTIALSAYEVESNFTAIGALLNRWKTSRLVTYNRLD